MSTHTPDQRSAEGLATEFISNLRALSTGSYLRPEEKTFWESPYPETVVDQAQTILSHMIDAARDGQGTAAENAVSSSHAIAASDALTVRVPHSALEQDEVRPEPTPASKKMIGQIQPHVEQLKQLSDQHLGAVLDVEEIDELVQIVEVLAEDGGAQASVVGGHVRAVCED
ncbi:hypothetical protein F7230_00460 [Corynebacterium sp. 320]|uniref:hypothetical protein n=1 Tax=Corynebacterium TaxID=1716 RepID=UPI00125CADA6|nr:MULTISPECIES: hypothetical protein [Corynebacterium]KAB1503642.1 hypothetical protein F7230_00460 [Corynebacterium sp. 320]KAB1553257.1 hypothetical protein F7233_06130 [Corynebacterium sp. 321]KAB1553524.1 hypothetical protein F7232_00455 [Corynebacterium sp. 319]KAB3527778.1 hypothetical protein F8354_00460 [Corynebacterium sp. 250]KAB3540733.1 hypothetical protein F8390_05875 [Corynebacterium sp. 366]